MTAMSGNAFFDPSRAKGPREGADIVGRPAQAGRDVTAEFVCGGGRETSPMSVSDLLVEVREALAGNLPRRLAVVGEISNFKRHSSGHMYFSLKDSGGQIGAVMFRSAANKLKFDPEDGLEVVAEGRVDVYEAQGKLQFYVERLSPKGAGALELAFRQLVAKLEAEGLFDPTLKRPLPAYPRTICVITSPTGAAIRDIRRTLARRWPSATVYLIGVRVQGDTAAGEIARAIALVDANADRLGIETLIVGRGGGSIEDLWPFNEEIVARAIFDSRVPVVSGVGHETDTTIADMAADVRAATPTAAAERATPDGQQLRRLLGQFAGRLDRTVQEQLARGVQALRLVERAEIFRNPRHRVRTLAQRVDEAATRMRAALIERHGRAGALLQRLANALGWGLGGLAKRKSDLLTEQSTRLARVHPAQRIRLGRHDLYAHRRQLAMLARATLAAARAQVDRHAQTLEALSYRSALRRGFSVTRTTEGKIVRQPADARAGQAIRTELADGEIRSVVDGVAPRTRKRKPADDNSPTLF